jgi:LysR family hydrogen peroxide-inducible transcriptional activator
LKYLDRYGQYINMNLSQLRFARAVAEHRSFSRAAQSCHVTQPTLSNGIAQLEDELEGKLFERTTRSVSLTPLGKHLLSSIERALSDVEEIRSLAKAWRYPDHKLIRLGLSPVVDMRLLLDVLTPFRERNPDVEFFFKECFVDDLDQRLGAGQIDLMLLPSREAKQGQQRMELYSEPLVYVPRDGGPLDGTDRAIYLREAAADNLILTTDGCGLRRITQSLFANDGHTIQEYPGQAISYQAVQDWASLGIGGCILPQSKVTSGHLSARPLLTDAGEPATVALHVLWQTNSIGAAHLGALIEHLKTKGHQLAKGIAA